MARRRTPPNILHVMFDQMSAPSLPCYGHPLVKAPNLRALPKTTTVERMPASRSSSSAFSYSSAKRTALSSSRVTRNSTSAAGSL